MQLMSMIGAGIVTFALIAYGIAIFTEQRNRKISGRVLVFLTIGVILDISATVCMIIGSSNTPFTFHGFLGYSALMVMLIDVIRMWGKYRKKGINASVPKGLHLYSRFAFSWWVVAYITGGLLVMVG